MNELIAIIALVLCIGVIVFVIRIYKETPGTRKKPGKD